MQMYMIILVLSTAALLIGSVSSLSCWVCTSLLDPTCAEDSIPNSPSGKIIQSDCSKVPRVSATGILGPRTTPATSCLKSVISSKGGSELIVRSCISPDDLEVKDATTARCDKGSHEGTTFSICYCQGDYCNGSETLKLTSVLAILPLGLFLASRF